MDDKELDPKASKIIGDITRFSACSMHHAKALGLQYTADGCLVLRHLAGQIVEDRAYGAIKCHR